ncbi:Protein NETWORKED [Vigna angularis]|uniref:Protein NETWORKED n=1 Tax=Phaseolus angularis TaxID=3914 RepID=A0A8T0KQZ3_PHAAN|nr:Protein NETWORKED [Vigna angularis]
MLVMESDFTMLFMAELNEKTKVMSKLVEEDAGSFAERAEMYYKKRPQLVSMLEDFYRTHRSLAERYDQIAGIRLEDPFSPLKHHQEEEYEEFEIDDPE